MKPRIDQTLHGYEIPDPDTRTRLALVESDVRHMSSDVSELKASVKGMDDKLDQVLLALAGKPKSSPPGDGLSFKASGKALATLAAVVAGLGAAVTKLVEFLQK